MKNKLITLIGAMLCFAAINLHATLLYTIEASTNADGTMTYSTNSPSFTVGLEEIGQSIADATNISVAAYGTYVSKGAPVHWGAGVLALYNFNDYVGTGLGLDWFGNFSFLSANATLQVPIQLSKYTSITWLTNITIIPGALGGVLTATSGSANTGNVGTIAGMFFDVDFGHFLGGRFGAGAAYNTYNGAWTGKQYHGFVKWSRGGIGWPSGS